MISLVWNDIPATQLVTAAKEVQRLAEAGGDNGDNEEAMGWAQAAIAAAAAVDPFECELAPFEAFAAALTALGDEKLVKDAAGALEKSPPALFALAAAARQAKWNETADGIMVRCLAQSVTAAWPGEFAYQQEWRQQYEEKLVSTLLKVWKKLASRAVAKETVSFATESEELDGKQVEESLKALLTPADLWPRPVQRRRSTRSRQPSSSRSRGGRRTSASGRSQRSSSRTRTTRKPESEAN